MSHLHIHVTYGLTLSVPLLGIPNKRILTLFAPLKCWMSYLGLNPLGRGTALMLFVISFSSVNPRSLVLTYCEHVAHSHTVAAGTPLLRPFGVLVLKGLRSKYGVTALM